MKQYILALFFMVISLSVTAREERGCFPNETPPCYKYERLPHDECKFVPIDAVDPDDICGPPAPTNNSSKQNPRTGIAPKRTMKKSLDIK